MARSKGTSKTRELRVVEFVAELLEDEANSLPPSMKNEGDNLRRAAKRMLESENPRIVRVHDILVPDRSNPTV